MARISDDQLVEIVLSVRVRVLSSRMEPGLMREGCPLCWRRRRQARV